MTRILTALTIVAAAFGTTACSSPEEKAVKFMEELAEITTKNEADCDKMGDALGKFMDDNADTIKSLKDMKSSKEQDKAMEEKYGERVKAAGMKMMGGAMKCATNEKVGAALKKMN